MLHDTGYLRRSEREPRRERRRVHQGARQPQRRVRRRLPAADRLRRRGRRSRRGWCTSPATKWTSTRSRWPGRTSACSAGWSAPPTSSDRCPIGCTWRNAAISSMPEFVWANIARERFADGHELVRYASAADLMVKTPGFYEYVARTRIEKKLGGADRFAEAHFDGPNLVPVRDRAQHRLPAAAGRGSRARAPAPASATRSRLAPASRPASALSA